jgi:hypothetical protein
MATFKISAGMRDHILSTLAADINVTGVLLKIYGSPTSQVAADALVPATAGAAIGSATLLSTLSVDGDGTGGTFDETPVDGVLVKLATESWYGTNVATGYPSFYRLVLVGDDGTLSTTAWRLQGSVGLIGKDFIVKSVPMTIDVEQRADAYALSLPME